MEEENRCCKKEEKKVHRQNKRICVGEKESTVSNKLLGNLLFLLIFLSKF